MKTKIFLLVLVVVAIALGYVMVLNNPNITGKKLLTKVSYSCDANKTILAQYYDGGPMPSPLPGKAPKPTGYVQVSFGNVGPITLYQTISADGARYANVGESLVFWAKGANALIMRNNTMDQTYKNCVMVSGR